AAQRAAVGLDVHAAVLGALLEALPVLARAAVLAGAADHVRVRPELEGVEVEVVELAVDHERQVVTRVGHRRAFLVGHGGLATPLLRLVWPYVVLACWSRSARFPAGVSG